MLCNYAWVARKVELERRHETLSFQHHAEVSFLALKEQDKWLDLARNTTDRGTNCAGTSGFTASRMAEAMHRRSPYPD
jgi:hypothetical protein